MYDVRLFGREQTTSCSIYNKNVILTHIYTKCKLTMNIYCIIRVLLK